MYLESKAKRCYISIEMTTMAGELSHEEKAFLMAYSDLSISENRPL